MIGRSGERGSGISVLAARHDDDDDEYLYERCYLESKHNNWIGVKIRLLCGCSPALWPLPQVDTPESTSQSKQILLSNPVSTINKHTSNNF